MWWCMLITAAVGRQRQEDCEFKANLHYIRISYLKNKKLLLNTALEWHISTFLLIDEVLKQLLMKKKRFI
jgi:hypothetical protein